MAAYTKLNLLQDVEDMAPRFGMGDGIEAHFARKPLGLEKSGASYFKLGPDYKLPFGHRHGEQEEVYVVLAGSARFKVEDEIVELGELDAIRFEIDTMRAVEAGPSGVEYLAFGSGTDPSEVEMVPGWWND